MTKSDAIYAPLQELATRLSDPIIRDINRVLEEAFFFYERDQPVLFDKLRENADLFAAHWERTTGYRLVVTPQVAYRRLPSENADPSVGFLNPRLKPAQRDLLAWTGQGMSMRTTVYLMFLKFAEEELSRRSADGNGDREFHYVEFYKYAHDQFRIASAAGGWKNPVADDDSRALHASIKDVLEKLQRFRFVELDRYDTVKPEDIERLGVTIERLEFYRALPGIYTYESRALDQSLLDKTFAAPALPEAEMPTETQEGPDDGA